MSHKCEMGSLGNRVNNYIISLYGHRWQLNLWSLWNVKKYQITVLCTRNQHSAIGKLSFKKKEIDSPKNKGGRPGLQLEVE